MNMEISQGGLSIDKPPLLIHGQYHITYSLYEIPVLEYELNVSKLQIEDSPGYSDWESGGSGLGVRGTWTESFT